MRAKIGNCSSRNRRGTQVGVIQYPIWQQVGPALPKHGDVDGLVAANMREVDPYWNGYMERSRGTARRHVALHPASFCHERTSRWMPESPERWDYTTDPHAVGTQSYGSLVTAR